MTQQTTQQTTQCCSSRRYLKRLLSNDFEKRYIPTLGNNKSKVSLMLPGEEEISFNVFDTAGQEKYSFNPLPHMDVVIIFFDCLSKLSLQGCYHWMKIAQSFYKSNYHPCCYKG